jgi:hypothetical protein
MKEEEKQIEKKEFYMILMLAIEFKRIFEI